MFDQLRAQGNNSIAPLLLSNYQKQQLFLGAMTSGGGNVDGWIGLFVSRFAVNM